MENAKKSNIKTILLIILLVLVCMIPVAAFLAFIFSPSMYNVTTARWTTWDEENTNNVVTAMGEDNTEERFRRIFSVFCVQGFCSGKICPPG